MTTNPATHEGGTAGGDEAESGRRVAAAGPGLPRGLGPAGIALAVLLLAPGPSWAQELYLTAGSGLYESDEFCLDPETTLSSWRLGLAGSDFGVSVSYEDEDWPWPDPPPGSDGSQSLGLQQIALRHGSAFQVVGEAHPLGLLGLDDSRLSRFVRPFVGAGIHVARDGEPGTDGPGGVPVYGIRGGTDVILTAGASVTARPAFLPFGIQLQYRATSLFGSDFEFESPGGEVVRSEGSETLVWGELTAGISVDIGG